MAVSLPSLKSEDVVLFAEMPFLYSGHGPFLIAFSILAVIHSGSLIGSISLYKSGRSQNFAWIFPITRKEPRKNRVKDVSSKLLYGWAFSTIRTTLHQAKTCVLVKES